MTTKIKEKKALVSVIIPTYNRKKDLDLCLKTILKQTYENKEVIVVDDCSSDNTSEYIKKKYPKVKIIVNKKNRGPNYCINRGVVNSKGEYISILDSDVELTNKGQIENMIKIIKSNKKIGSLGGYYLPNNKRIFACGLKRSFILNSEYNAVSKNNLSLLKECDWIAGNNFFTTKKLFYELGGYDESSVGEDTELFFGLTLKEMGYINLFGPSIALKHNESSAERDNIGVQKISGQIDKSKYRLIWRYRNRIRYLIAKNSFLTKKTIRYILFYSFFAIMKNIISILAFIKQEYFHMGKKTSKRLFSNERSRELKSKFNELWFSIKILFDSYMWNLFHIVKTLKAKKTNFLDKRRFLIENET